MRARVVVLLVLIAIAACKKESAPSTATTPVADASAAFDARPPVINQRPTAVACSPSKHEPLEYVAGLNGCKDDAECAKRKGPGKNTNARCVAYYVGHARKENGCLADECAEDKDCRGTGEDQKGPCICGETGFPNRCLKGNCSIDADCGPNGRCSKSADFSCPELGAGYWCRTSADQCSDSRDCAPSGNKLEPSDCRYDPRTKRWACTSSSCRAY